MASIVEKCDQTFWKSITHNRTRRPEWPSNNFDVLQAVDFSCQPLFPQICGQIALYEQMSLLLDFHSARRQRTHAPFYSCCCKITGKSTVAVLDIELVRNGHDDNPQHIWVNIFTLFWQALIYLLTYLITLCERDKTAVNVSILSLFNGHLPSQQTQIQKSISTIQYYWKCRKGEVDQMLVTEWNGTVTNGLECRLYLLRQASYSFVVSNAISCLGSFVVGAQNVSPKNPFSCD